MKTKTKLLTLIISFIMIISTTIFAGCGLFGINCGGNSPVSRNAKNSDINIDLSQEIALNIKYKVTPKVNIDNLQITFKYYDNNDELQTTVIKNVGTVSKNVEISVSVSLTEFSFSEIFKIVKTSAEVTGGTVSLI